MALDLDITSTSSENPTVGWHPDPWGRHDQRYFDGSIWTDHVTHFGPTPCAGCGTEPSES